MLAENSFRPEHAARIARTLARFHREEAEVAVAIDDATPAGDPGLLQKEFADLETAYSDAREILSHSGRPLFLAGDPATTEQSGNVDSGSLADRIVGRACQASREFLAAHANEIRRRRELGLVRSVTATATPGIFFCRPIANRCYSTALNSVRKSGGSIC